MRRVWLTLSGVAVTLVAASSAHAAAWLTPPEALSAAGADATEPLNVAVDPAKDVFIAWARDPVVQVGVRPAGGSFGIASLYGCPVTQPPSICGSALDPDVAVDAGGNSIVAFTLDGRLKTFMRPAGGAYTELPEITSAMNVRTPKVAFAPDRTAIVVWQQDNVGLFAAERPPDGSFGAPIPIFTEAGGEQVLRGGFELATGGTAHAMVGFVTDMFSAGGETTQVKTAIRAPAGWGAAQLVDEESVPSDASCLQSIGASTPAVALDAAANAVIAFRVQRRSEGTMCAGGPRILTKVVAARRPLDLGTWTPPAPFDEVPPGANLEPAAVFTSSGEALVAWVRFEGSTGVIRHMAGPPSSSTFGAVADVPGTTVPLGESLSDPRLVPVPGGGVLLGYSHIAAPESSIEYALRPAGGPFADASPAAMLAAQPLDLSLGGSPAGDVAATWLEDNEAGDALVRSLIYDASPPAIADVTVPANGEVGQQLAMSASAADAFSPVTLNWAFGDGGTAAGSPATHAYGMPGSFDVMLTAADAAGNTSSATRTTSIGGGTGTDPTPEFLGDILLSNARLRAAARGPSAITTQRRRRRAPVGTRVSFRLSEAASVRFTVERARPGRRVRGRCVKPTRRNRKRRKCARYVRQRGSFTVAAGAGETRFRFTGRLRGRKLRPGRYRLVAVATDATGHSSAPERARFAIVR